MFFDKKKYPIMPFVEPPSTFNLPEDGAYPPRLLAVKNRLNLNFTSIPYWLYRGQKIKIVEGVLSAKNAGDSCILEVYGDIKTWVKVNGAPIYGRYTLQDGDFIVINNGTRFIFQLDPVQARRTQLDLFTDMMLPDEVLSSMEVTNNLRKYVIITQDGLSFDGGYHFVSMG